MARPCLLQTVVVDFVWPGLTGTVIYCLSGKQPLHVNNKTATIHFAILTFPIFTVQLPLVWSGDSLQREREKIDWRASFLVAGAFRIIIIINASGPWLVTWFFSDRDRSAEIGMAPQILTEAQRIGNTHTYRERAVS
ncbi:hypothetical protein T07_10610 [Trichinella nelsoni]|uniref:Uncharacterized protein n=1 Tax=Trichinella nelsoni TaxID=6336 RepID=A0A0V0S3N2_9BILA|nr:hypothetical protein T07_10610 [Trichinella nelsoni]